MESPRRSTWNILSVKLTSKQRPSIWVLFHGGRYSLVRTTFTNVQFGLGDAAQNTLAFLKLVKLSGPNLVDELIDQAGPAEPDESITIN